MELEKECEKQQRQRECYSTLFLKSHDFRHHICSKVLLVIKK